MAVGDTTGDGLEELAVTRQYASEGAGQVWLFQWAGSMASSPRVVASGLDNRAETAEHDPGRRAR